MGLRVTAAQMIELTQALAFVDLGRRDDVFNTARVLLVNRQPDLAPFEQAFDLFWRTWSRGESMPPLEELIERLARQAPRPPTGAPRPRGPASNGREQARSVTGNREMEVGTGDEEGEGSMTLALYSADEALRTRDFSTFAPHELADARRFLSTARWNLARRRSRRTRPTSSGKQLDFRGTLRRAVRHGGELLDLSFRGPKLKRRSLVVLCDVSGSMDRYTRLLLHFLHSMERSVQRVEVFVFGTRLTRITPALRHRDPDAAVAAVASQVQDWSSGTRIGDALHTFNRIWARRVLGQGAIVIVISDGWDRGDPQLLATEMERLQRSSYRLIWLNPLLGSVDYRPLTRGIQAALPYVDDFLPVHNLASLEVLGELLNDIQDTRPSRGRKIYEAPE
jgi:uncharacterized protein with von Willebrand factor type A (vWA) domain